MFHAILYQPLFNLLIWLYNVLPGADLGFAIIGISIVVKLAMWPLSHASLKSQKALQELQPKLETLKVQYKDDKEGLAKAMMQLYQAEKVNPLSSCLPLLIQIPILFALYAVLQDGLNAERLVNLYPFVHNPGSVNPYFLGFIDLGQPHLVMAVIAGILQFFQTKMLMARRPPAAVRKELGAKDEDMMAAMNKSMLYVMPVMTVVIGASLPGGLTLYWIVMNLLSIVQQFLAFRSIKPASPVSLPVAKE
ncbi:membrane protein insertase YidC [Candidatus Uhrbacteria bacterium]|nr:membrane protein insertase YidC [Candidatus Uhrbacteria bacterium]